MSKRRHRLMRRPRVVPCEDCGTRKARSWHIDPWDGDRLCFSCYLLRGCPPETSYVDGEYVGPRF